MHICVTSNYSKNPYGNLNGFRFYMTFEMIDPKTFVVKSVRRNIVATLKEKGNCSKRSRRVLI